LVTAFAAGLAVCAEPGLPKTTRLLTEGAQPVRIVCFGDSITGVYYHTGGRRAWTDMLGIALQRVYPKAKLQMFNAGISGHTSGQGLKRIKRDVLGRKPHLVVVMFGMNDVVATPRATFAENLRQIVRQGRGVGAEVMLCTPNSIYPGAGRRPIKRLAEFAATVRGVAAELSVPLVDCYASYEAVRARDRLAWMLLMSEDIHPNMNGHKHFAEEITRVISGKCVSLADVRALEPCIPRTLALLAKDNPIRLIAMAPYDKIVPAVLAKLNPKSKVNVVCWPTKGKSLGELEAFAKGVREQKSDLVVIAVPADVGMDDTERFVRSYFWVMNWSLSFGRAERDVVAVLPSVTRPANRPGQGGTEALARRIVLAQDIGFVERSPGDNRPADQILLGWLRARHEGVRAKASD